MNKKTLILSFRGQ